MKIFATTLFALAAVASGNHHRHSTKWAEPVLPELSEKERASLAKFQNHNAFKQAWAVAGKRLHERLEQIRQKSHSRLHHRKHRVQQEE